MFDNKGFIIVGDILLALSGILFWFSSGFSNALGVIGFFPRLFSGIISFIIAFVITAIATR